MEVRTALTKPWQACWDSHLQEYRALATLTTPPAVTYPTPDGNLKLSTRLANHGVTLYVITSVAASRQSAAEPGHAATSTSGHPRGSGIAWILATLGSLVLLAALIGLGSAVRRQRRSASS
jgi:hypothetical protein